ncbi:UNVERIFIED_CONTAM: hypothetical protein NCL1_57035 [Trichonephila clavipes]
MNARIFKKSDFKIHGSLGSMMSILAGKVNSFIAEIVFSADCEDCHFYSEKTVNVKKVKIQSEIKL